MKPRSTPLASSPSTEWARREAQRRSEAARIFAKALHEHGLLGKYIEFRKAVR
jgi:hypothetical protein